MANFLPDSIDHAPGIIYISDNSTKTVQSCNKYFEEETGYTLAEMKSMGLEFFHAVMHPDDFPYALTAQKKFTTGERSYFYGHCRIRGKNDKDWKWVTGTAIPLTFEGDKVKEVICMFLPLAHKSDTPEQTKLAFQSMLRAIYEDDIQLLSQKEREVLSLVVNGYSEKMIADKLHIKVRTVEFHLEKMRHKFHVPNMSSLIAKAKDMGL